MKQSQSLIPVLIEHNKNITWLRLNNTSQLNALNPEMIDILTKEHNMEPDEANEFLEFNTIFAWMGDKTPIYLHTKEELLCQNIQ